MKSDKKQNTEVQVKPKKGLLRGFGETIGSIFNIFTGGMLRGKK